MPIRFKSFFSILSLIFILLIGNSYCVQAKLTDNTVGPLPKKVTTCAVEVGYAEVSVIRFNELRSTKGHHLDILIPQDLSALNVSIEGNIDTSNIYVDNKEIRFIAPSDPGHDKKLKIKVKLDDNTIMIPVIIRSSFYTNVRVYDPVGEGNLPMMVVTGLGQGNKLLPNEMTFSVPNAPQLSMLSSGGMIYILAQSQKIGLSQYWQYDETHNRFVISQATMQTLFDMLPTTELEFSVGLSDEPGKFGYDYSFTAFKAQARLSGTFVDDDGKPLTDLAGSYIGIRGQGYDNNIRRIAQLDSNAQFTIDDLIVGTYWVELLDPQEINHALASAVIDPDTTQVTIEIPVLQNAKLD